jgi:DNA uptake protein ComE-like DNA-binding protein
MQIREMITIERSSRTLAAPNAKLRDQRGVALLAVLWLTVALTFMGMATAHMVRTEVDAVSNQIDWDRSYYLASGCIEAAMYSIARYSVTPPASADAPIAPSQFAPGKRWLEYQFPGGACDVEIVPEQAKLNINRATPDQLAALFAVLGLSPNDSLQLAAAIADWRAPRSSEAGSIWDLYYASLAQPYRARHAPIERLEELLPVRGLSHDMFFGHVEKTSAGPWRKWPPFADLLTTQAAATAVNPNYASYEVLRSLPGWNESMAAGVIAARARAPFRTFDDLQSADPAIAITGSLANLTFAAGPVYTLTATGYLPGSPVRRSVRALVQIDRSIPLYHRVFGWWDDWPAANESPRAGGFGDHSKGGSST